MRTGSTSTDDAAKTHASAVCIVPPEEVWEPIQEIRRRYDRQVRRWMPHINLLYPFRPPERFDEAIESLRAVCATEPRFSIRLAEFKYFSHRKANATLWLVPEPTGPITALQRALEERFPDCDDTSRFADGFTPHLSVGQARGRAELVRRLDHVRSRWSGLEFEVTEAVLIHRHRKEPFRVVARMALGDPEPGHDRTS